jgi:hypothetical protein
MSIEPIDNPYRVVHFQKSQKVRRVQSREHDERETESHDEPPAFEIDDQIPDAVQPVVEETQKPLEQKQPKTDENDETKKHLDIRI